MTTAPKMVDRFETNLYAAFLKSGKAQSNVIYSPLLVKMCLAIIYMATDGPARKELATVLQYSGKETDAVIAKEFRNFFEKAPIFTPDEDEWYYSPLPTAKPDWHIKTVLYVPHTIDVNNKYKSFLKENFQTNVTELSSYAEADLKNQNSIFSKNPPYGTSNVTMVTSSNLNQKSSFVLASMVYLNATWVHTFVQGATADNLFQKQDVRDKHYVRTMTQHGWIPYVRLPEMDAHAVEMPLQNSNLSMIIVMPLRLNTLERVLNSLQKADLRSIVKRMKFHNLRLNVPVFQIECNLDLLPILRKMGLQKIFQSGHAQYSKMTTSKAPISVSNIIHKVFIDVNERGLDFGDYIWIGSGSFTNFMLPINGLDILRPFFFALMDDVRTYYIGYSKDPKRRYSGTMETY